MKQNREKLQRLHSHIRNRRDGFIILFGTKNVLRTDGTAVETACPRCNETGKIVGKSARQWFTIFFIPIIPMGSRTYFTECTHCNAQFGLSVAEFNQRMAGAEQEKTQIAIQMYNSLRQSPANSVTLNDLMSFYAGMNEFDQAISAARDFPDALNNSEQCQCTLGRVHLAANQYANALTSFDAAIARNSSFADAYYYKAITCMEMTPPDLAIAQAAARNARNNEHPRANDLLRTIEQKQREAHG